MSDTSPPSHPKPALIADLKRLIEDWGYEAKHRREDGLTESAALLKQCRAELQGILRRHRG